MVGWVGLGWVGLAWLGLGWAGRVGVLGALIFGDACIGGGGGGLAWGLTGLAGADVFICVCMCRGRR